MKVYGLRGQHAALTSVVGQGTFELYKVHRRLYKVAFSFFGSVLSALFLRRSEPDVLHDRRCRA